MGQPIFSPGQNIRLWSPGVAMMMRVKSGTLKPHHLAAVTVICLVVFSYGATIYYSILQYTVLQRPYIVQKFYFSYCYNISCDRMISCHLTLITAMLAVCCVTFVYKTTS